MSAPDQSLYIQMCCYIFACCAAAARRRWVVACVHIRKIIINTSVCRVYILSTVEMDTNLLSTIKAQVLSLSLCATGGRVVHRRCGHQSAYIQVDDTMCGATTTFFFKIYLYRYYNNIPARPPRTLPGDHCVYVDGTWSHAGRNERLHKIRSKAGGKWS